MDKGQYELHVEVIEEAGLTSALIGISLNKNQTLNKMPAVAKVLATKDFGHNKFLEQIMVWMFVKAPRYVWQEMDTFRLSSKSSQSTMHTILKNYLDIEDFECGDIDARYLKKLNELVKSKDILKLKRTLPEGFLQKRMWMMSYKTLRNIIIQRRKHKLPHWQKFISDVLSQVKNPEFLPEL